jgi:3',5'-cyclic-AMP phosphodiesterase
MKLATPPELVHVVSYRTSGTEQPAVRTLEFSVVRYVPETPLAMCFVATADLQGRERGPENRLLGEFVAEELAALTESSTIPRPSFCCLCGDFYDYPDLHKRGGTGDVTSVLNAFARCVGPTLAVLGNHDELHGTLHPEVQLLDGQIRSVAGVRIGGVSGIVGNPERNQRKTEGAFLRSLESVLNAEPEIVLLHQGPEGPTERFRGWGTLNATLEYASNRLVLFGHCHWPEPFFAESGNLYANVDSRVLIFVPEG